MGEEYGRKKGKTLDQMEEVKKKDRKTHTILSSNGNM